MCKLTPSVTIFYVNDRFYSQSNLKVVMGLLFPPSILLLEFKSREELMQQPQTAAEHAEDLSAETSSADSEDSGRSSLEISDDDDDETPDPELGEGRRRTSTYGSNTSVNLASVRVYSFLLAYDFS